MVARYARFRRADLQMQTPVDRHNWQGRAVADGGSGLAAEADVEEVDVAARRYADRCAEVGLEIVGLTDHNLGGPLAESFYPALVRHLAKRATVFPGFEIEAKVGKGCHFLCLFEPGTTVADLSQILAQLGLPEGMRFKSGRPIPSPKDLDEICETVQREHGGLIVLAHPFRSKGVCHDDYVPEWWSQEVIRDPRIGCLELPRPRKHYTSGRIASILNGTEGWERDYPIAAVNDSDCKRLSPDDGVGEESCIGKRWTWIKTGQKPSIEGLRQAFVDHESRIAFPEDWDDYAELAPDSQPSRRRIEKISVRSVAFLADQQIEFSPQLNVVIGGGGSGKSTVLEYLRMGTEAEGLGPSSSSSGNLQRIERTIQAGTEIELTLWDGGTTVTALVTRAGVLARDSDGNEVGGLPARFPISYVGQREVYAIASDMSATAQIVDQLEADKINDLHSKADRIVHSLERLDGMERELVDLESRRETVAQEIARKQAQIRARRGLVEPLERLDALRAEQRVLDELDRSLKALVADLEGLADGMALPVSLVDLEARDTSHLVAIQKLRDDAARRIGETEERLRAVISELRQWSELQAANPVRDEIAVALDEAMAAYDSARGHAEGAETLDQLRQDLDTRTYELDELDLEIASRRDQLEQRAGLLAELRSLWEQQTKVRWELANRLNEAVPATADPVQRYVEIKVDAFGDVQKAVKRLCSLLDDRRSFNDRDAAELVELLQDHRDLNEHPFDLVRRWLDGEEAPAAFSQLSGSRRQALRSALTQQREVERYRVPDRISVTVFREDGRRVGTLDDGLSVGQKCLAILSLLLALGDDPIVIDQPEEEMDNEFIYRELVPLIRRARQERQVILATHNANIPVNGDAELIVALQAGPDTADGTRSRGWQKSVSSAYGEPGGSLAVGPLDLAAVRQAVEEIMEGSEDAFKRRQAKYGF